jgi:hypothetical protein
LQENDDIEYLPKSSSTDLFINLIERVIFQKWYTEVQIVVNKEYYFTIVALLDSGADSNCIQEELIPAKYYERTTEGLSQASGTSLVSFSKSPSKPCKHFPSLSRNKTFSCISQAISQSHL